MDRIHDSRLLAYQVDFVAKAITLEIEYGKARMGRVVFTDVLAHYFKDIGEMETILFGIDCCEIEDFIEENRALLQERKDYGWPLLTYADESTLVMTLKEKGQKYFSICASCGLSGFVLAKNVMILDK